MPLAVVIYIANEHDENVCFCPSDTSENNIKKIMLLL